MERKKIECVYCGWIWLSDKNPQTCPRCNNPTNKKPKMKNAKSK